MYRNFCFHLKLRNCVFISRCLMITKEEISCQRSRPNFICFSTSNVYFSTKAVHLSYSVFKPESLLSSPIPVIILHGLLGSKQNWRGLGNAIASKSKRKVYALDARNHGESPHVDDINYPLMAEDVKHFMNSHEIPEAVIIGHSMGGRTAMYLSLTNEDLVNKLVIVDVSPVTMPNESSLIPDYMRAMKDAMSSVPKSSVKEVRRSVTEYLSKVIQEIGMRQFLLTNLVEENNIVKWKPNIDVLLEKYQSQLTNMPPVSSCYLKDTVFICGGNSLYVKPKDYPDILKVFPKAEFVTIPGAGHWVHSEKPSEFLNVIYDIL